MSYKVQQSVCSDCVTYVKSIIKFNTFNTFNNVTAFIVSSNLSDAMDSVGKTGVFGQRIIEVYAVTCVNSKISL